MEIKAKSMINNKQNDEYFIPLEPNHALALTMNFPQFPERPSSQASLSETEFDYNCPDCMADLFGPLMAPYAALQKQMDDYRRRLESIAHQRYTTMRNSLVNSFERDSNYKSKRSYKHPFRYDRKDFLSKNGAIARYITMISSGWILIIAIGLLGLSMYIIFVDHERHPMLTFIRTCSKFYRTFFFQAIIGYLVGFSILLIIAAACALLGALLCSFLLTLSGTVSILVVCITTITLPMLLYIWKESLTEKLETFMQMSIRDYDGLAENPITIFWNEFQMRYSCCGFQNATEDYRTSYFHELTGSIVPDSCCQTGETCSNAPNSNNSLIGAPCVPQARRVFEFTVEATSVGHILLVIFLLIVFISIGVLLFHMDSAKQALTKYNERCIKLMLLKHNAEDRDADKQLNHEILPITPTVVRVRSPRIRNYFGFNS